MPVWSKRLLLMLASTAFALVLAEAGVRLLGLGPAQWAHPWHLESADKLHGVDVYPDDPRGYFEVDVRDPAVAEPLIAHGVPEVRERAELTPHGVLFRYSIELCRGPAVPAKGDRPRVLAIGDSFTEGQGVRESDTWAERLEALSNGQQEVINCGRRGHDFPEIHEFFERQLPLEPDAVVYAMTLNDVEQSESFHDQQEFLNDWILDRRRMYMDAPQSPSFWDSRLVALIEDRLEAVEVGQDTTRWYRAMFGEENAEGWQATQDHIAAMDAEMRSRGGRFLVALWPLFVDLDTDYPFRSVHATIRSALEARGVRFVDTLDAFSGTDPAELWVHPTDRHPNERAHALFAERVHAALEAP